MATERLSMRKIREILRQKWVLGRSHRDVAQSVGVSTGAIGSVLAQAKEPILASWSDVEKLDDAALELALYGAAAAGDAERGTRPEPDCAWIHRERSRPGVTLELLHHEYLTAHSDGYRYTAFCDRYRAWLSRRGMTMRQVHVAGEKLFVDYSGKRPEIVDRETGEVTPWSSSSRCSGRRTTRTRRRRVRSAARTGSRATCGRWSSSEACRRPSCATS